MKATGVVRKVDELGRVVIPVEVRRNIGIEVKDPLEIYVTDDGSIVLKKYQPGCQVCNSVDDLIEVSGLNLCKKCIGDFASRVK